MGWFDKLFGSKEGTKGRGKQSGKPYVYKNGKWILDVSRKQNNTSPTQDYSQFLEDEMFKYIIDRQNLRVSKGGSTTWKYAIPYLKEKEIILTGTKDHQGMKISTNALDSIAKYAGMVGVDKIQALGLPFQETAKGNHFGFKMYEHPKNEEEREANRALLNAEYFRNFGIIPAENFVNNHEYIDGGYNNGNPIIDRSPLQHAFEHYNLGRYNPGDPNHTRDVTKSGEDVWRSPEIQKWWKESGQKFYNQK